MPALPRCTGRRNALAPRILARLLLSVLAVSLTGGCAATVYPGAKPVQPTAVYLADYGIHSSVLLPAGDGRYVEYAFGDWNFAALNHCWPQDAFGALLISFQSTLGRRYIEVGPGQLVPHPVHLVPHTLQVVYASRANVDRLVRELDERYRRDGSQSCHNPDNDMDYVKDGEHYWIANNCNHLTARCLRELGCDVHGLVVLSKFDVAQVQTPPSIEPIRVAIANVSPESANPSAAITARGRSASAAPEPAAHRSEAAFVERAESLADKQSSPPQTRGGPTTQPYRPPEQHTSVE